MHITFLHKGKFMGKTLKDIFLGAIEEKKDWNVKVYMINVSDKPMTFEVMQGSIYGDDDSLMDLGHSDYRKLTIPSKGYVQIDQMNDPGELDFLTYYDVKFAGQVYSASINGWSLIGPRVGNVPILNQRGYVSSLNRDPLAVCG